MPPLFFMVFEQAKGGGDQRRLDSRFRGNDSYEMACGDFWGNLWNYSAATA